MRTIDLEEFRHFLLAILEEGRKAMTTYSESVGELLRQKKRKRLA